MFGAQAESSVQLEVRFPKRVSFREGTARGDAVHRLSLEGVQTRDEANFTRPATLWYPIKLRKINYKRYIRGIKQRKN